MKKTICGLFVLSLLVLTPPLFAKTCQGSADCDDKDSCTSDSCSNGTCFHLATCIQANAPPSPPAQEPVNQAALAECLKTCKDEPCWDASCTNDGKCFKLATCIGASSKEVVPFAPRPPASISPSLPPPPPPPPPPIADDKTPRPEEGEQPLKRCEELPSEMRACCVKYDDPANEGDGNGRLNGKELARLIKDETCQPPRPSGSGPSPSIADECSGYFKVFAGEGSKVTVNGFNQCCQVLRNKGEAVNLTMQQNCENHMGLAVPASVGGDVSAPAGAPVTGKSLTDESKADEGGCQLIRPE